MNYTNEEILKRIEKAKKNKAKLTHITDKSDLSIDDRLKISLCRHFVQYINEKKIKSVDLAKLLNIPASRISEIVNYKIKAHSIEHLLNYLQLLSKYSPKIREYLNLLGIAVQAPSMSASKTKEISKSIKNLYSEESGHSQIFAS
jgi:predicted XRE-type DNA-binding protein